MLSRDHEGHKKIPSECRHPKESLRDLADRQRGRRRRRHQISCEDCGLTGLAAWQYQHALSSFRTRAYRQGQRQGEWQGRKDKDSADLERLMGEPPEHTRVAHGRRLSG